jgi:hypothetical protein
MLLLAFAASSVTTPCASAASRPGPGRTGSESALAVGDTIVSRMVAVRVDMGAVFAYRDAISREFQLRSESAAALAYHEAISREFQLRSDSVAAFAYTEAFSREFEVRHAAVYVPFAYHEAFSRAFHAMGYTPPADVTDLPLMFAFHPPSPNPSVGGALLRFDLPVRKTVTVDVLDVQGRRVQTLADRRAFPAGRHSLRMERGRLPSGLYFVRVLAGENHQTRRLVVIE